uniref:Bactericidal permeability-increasing protein n=1 Tax=Sinocyclocheilus rhinocerous TaxID=307959 RepID=A0A673H1S2_9TELE
MFLWWVLVLVNLVSVATGTNAGVKVRLTQKGLEYAETQHLTIKVPDISGTEKVDLNFPDVPVRMQIVNLGLPKSALGLVPDTGVMLSIGNAYINLHGNWRVKYLRIIKDSGSFDLAVSELTISTTIAVTSDDTSRATVSMTNCAATVNVKFHGGKHLIFCPFISCFHDSWLHTVSHSIYLLFQICPLVADSIADINPHLKTLNVLAKVDQYAEIEYSMVGSPVVSNTSIDLGLKVTFSITEPPFSPTPFSLPSQDTDMAGALRLYITDDMIPSGSPICLNTKTFGTFIPQADSKMIYFRLRKSVVTAYTIQPNSTLFPLFVLNLEGSVSTHIYVTELKMAGNVTLNKIDMSLAKSYVGPFQVVVIPKVNARLQEGYPLPAIGKMQLVNSQLQVLKGNLMQYT